MKIDVSRLKTWLKVKNGQLPGLENIFQQAESDVLVIGAAVFEIYETLEWITPLKRKTGDIDLSIGVLNSSAQYESAKQILLKHQYTQDGTHPYRYRPEKAVPGGFSYIDLLAHPARGDADKRFAIDAMGVGPGFSFQGFQFAGIEHFPLVKGAIFPNPFGLMSLKRASYLEEPVKRIKDFADIVELVNGLTEKGTHFQMTELWQKVGEYPESKQIREILKLSSNMETVGDWDIENIRSELNGRGFDDDFIDESLMRRLRDFNDAL